MVAAGIIAALVSGAWALARLLPSPQHRDPSRLLAASLSVKPALGLSHSAARDRAPDPSFFFDGAFYQPNLAQGFADPERRRSDLARLASLGGTTVWLQYLAHGDYSLLDPFPERQDPVRGLLDDAHSLGLKVWLGTREDPRLWSDDEVPLAVWKDAGDKALLIAEEAAARYGQHPAFAGWYWTPEVVWPRAPSPERLRRLSAITAGHLASLRRLVPGTPVAMVLGPGGNLGEEVPARGWCRLLAEASPEVVVVMDGVGSGHVDLTQLDMVYTAAAGCAALAGATLVADVEVFGPGLPPDRARLRAQMDAAWRSAPVVVAFDLPHHLGPGTEAVALWSGKRPRRPIVPAREHRDPEGDWLAVRRGLGTIELTPAAARSVGEAELVSRYPHPQEVSLSLDEGRGWKDRGSLRRYHGPGRDEVTWRLALPGGPVPVSARFTLARGTGELDVVAVRLRAR